MPHPHPQAEPAIPSTSQIFWTARETMAALRISRDGLHKLTHRDRDPIPFKVIGKRLAYKPQEVLTWVERQTEHGKKLIARGLAANGRRKLIRKRG